ncbi:response regulator [Levilactobacillus enshiensis]|uniref:response regulator n=1 Tax=Levilactobacillus enshiensis TaxID=2590213 RepID=UPI00117A9898|nr:response regulator [Levilactobacillus enshiensis]
MKILIVEDDPMVRLINHKFLERVPALQAATIVECESAVAALALPDLDQYALILLDMYLPQLSGTAFLAELLKRQLHPQVIMMTAANDQQTLKEAVNYGVLDFLIKPFSFDRFAQAMAKFTRLQVVDDKNTVSQRDLDSLFQGNTVVASPQEARQKDLPKGLAKLSLQRIVTVIRNRQAEFSNQDIADDTGLSRVSTKKYIDFLATIGFLSSRIVYQGSGRPLTKFSLDENGEAMLQTYIQ